MRVPYVAALNLRADVVKLACLYQPLKNQLHFISGGANEAVLNISLPPYKDQRALFDGIFQERIRPTFNELVTTYTLNFRPM